MTQTRRFNGVLPTETMELIEKVTPAAPVLTPTLEYKGFNRGLSQVLHVD